MRARSRLADSRLGTALAGVVFVAVIVSASAVGIASGFGVFSHSAVVTARLPTAGPALGPGAEVEYRGVLVGSLGRLDRAPDHALLTLDIDPAQLSHIPAGVSVRLVPRSVFGDLYVDLVPPTTVAGHLQSGAVLAADTATPSVELNQALDDGYQLLTAIQPSKLAATLGAISTALDGRGEKLGALVSRLATYTAEVAPHTDQLLRDITGSGALSREVAANHHNLLSIFRDSIAVATTIHQDQPSLVRLLAAGPVVAVQTRQLLAANRGRLRVLVHQLAPVIRILGANRGNLTALLAGLQEFTDGAARALGQGPYLDVTALLRNDATRGRPYTAADCPHYGREKGPNCRHAARRATLATAKAAVIQAIVDRVVGADKATPTTRAGLQRLAQRLDIAGVLLTPVLESAGGLLP